MEELAYHEVGNERIAGVFHSASGSERRLVVMAHGFKGSKIGPSRYFVTLAREVALRGISVFRFDQPGSGDSSGAFEDSSFAHWISSTRRSITNKGWRSHCSAKAWEEWPRWLQPLTLEYQPFEASRSGALHPKIRRCLCRWPITSSRRTDNGSESSTG